MGCDMHGWIEIKQKDKYIAIKEQDFALFLRNVSDKLIDEVT